MSQDERRVNLSQVAPGRMRRPKREEVRDRLIEGAAKAFALKGFAGASIDFICAQAGFSRGAFYSNFDDKDALFFALYDRRSERLQARISSVLEAARGSADPLRTVGQMLSQPDADELHWDILNKEFIIHALRNPAARAKLLASRAVMRRWLGEVLKQLDPSLAAQPEVLQRLCRCIVAIHEGEMTQLGLEPDLAGQPTLLAEFVPALLAAARRG